MGDRCFLEMTLRREDLPKIAPLVCCNSNGEWWDDLHDHDSNPDLVNASVYEANYAWLDERQEAAKAGIAFMGTHGEGGCYGPCAFAAVDGDMSEAPLNHDGYLIIAVDDDLKPVEGAEDCIRAYVNRRRAVERLFEREEAHDVDQPESDPAVPAGLCGP